MAVSAALWRVFLGANMMREKSEREAMIGKTNNQYVKEAVWYWSFIFSIYFTVDTLSVHPFFGFYLLNSSLFWNWIEIPFVPKINRCSMVISLFRKKRVQVIIFSWINVGYLFWQIVGEWTTGNELSLLNVWWKQYSQRVKMLSRRCG